MIQNAVLNRKYISNRIDRFKSTKPVLNRDLPACPRCMTPSRDADGDHDPSNMIAWDYCREPRDLEHTKRVLIECADMTSRSAAGNHASRLGIWPEVPAAMGLTHFNIYLQVVSDSMHVWDGGLTERVLVYVACWIYKKAEDQTPQTGWPAVHLINCRLAAVWSGIRNSDTSTTHCSS